MKTGKEKGKDRQFRKMRRIHRKGEASLEFFAGYTRAILVIFVALAVLTHFGILTPNKLAPEACSISAGLDCVDNEVTSSEIRLQIHNGLGMAVALSNITADGCEGVTKGELNEQEGKEFVITGCDLEQGEKYSGQFYITYTGYTGLDHRKVGHIDAKVK